MRLRPFHLKVEYIAVLLWAIVLLPGSAQSLQSFQSADELVRQTALHELAAATDDGHYLWRVQEDTPRGSETRDMVETRNWLISCLVLRNGRPLSVSERRREDERLRAVLSSPARLRLLQKQKSAQKERVRKMIAAFPSAFFCRYDGPKSTITNHALIRVKFRPNPKFIARSWELRPLQGMEGSVLIDPVEKRLVQMEAKFIREVDFGWGVVGRIERGGTFKLQQRCVGGNQWAITTLAWHYNRRVLFMSSRVDSVMKVCEFRRLPENLSLRQGLEQILDHSRMTIVFAEPKH